jgi:hypothetical protein
MKGVVSKVLIVGVLLGLVGYSAASNLEGAKGKPDVFCRVLKEPEPILLGSWKCSFERKLEEGGWENNPAEYRLIKYEDKYALYFYRVSRGGKKKFMGWRDWTIDGSQILSDSGVRIYTAEGQVFFVWQDGKPTRMTRTGMP